MQARLISLAIFPALIVGCDESPTASSVVETKTNQVQLGARFDPSTTGSIRGRVEWSGVRPKIAPFRSIENPLTDQATPPPPREWANPNAPKIDEGNNVTSAVVFLRGIDLEKSRPWNHDPVRVEMKDFAFQVEGRFVRVGDEVEFVSRQPIYHYLQLRGAAFQSLTFPIPDQPRKIRFDQPGCVELLSGAGLYWMRGYLLVDHHPYFTTTQHEGAFRLDDVPAGDYELIVWHPNWRIQREERNAESFRVVQVRYESPLEHKRSISVVAGRETVVSVPLR